MALSPTGRCWAAATTEGLLLYSQDDGMLFDPSDITEAITPVACRQALEARAFVRAALIALRLGEPELLRHVLMSTPLAQVCQPVPACLCPLFRGCSDFHIGQPVPARLHPGGLVALWPCGSVVVWTMVHGSVALW